MIITGNGSKFRVGVHTSIAGGVSKSVERAVALNCTTMQIFTHNPRRWQESRIPDEEVERFAYLRRKHDIDPVFSHCSYLINLASQSDQVLKRSVKLLSHELMNAERLGIEYVVLHTGSAGNDDETMARARAVRSLLEALDAGQFRSSLILENTAGERGDITSSISTLAEIMDKCGGENIAGICLDTCHAFSSGYDLRTSDGVEKLIYEINKYAGLDKLKLIHLNDSKKPLGSGVDRHENIGEGHIGIKGFENLLSAPGIAKVPLVLETPKKSDDDDRKNLERVFKIISGRTGLIK